MADFLWNGCLLGRDGVSNSLHAALRLIMYIPELRSRVLLHSDEHTQDSTNLFSILQETCQELSYGGALRSDALLDAVLSSDFVWKFTQTTTPCTSLTVPIDEMACIDRTSRAFSEHALELFMIHLNRSLLNSSTNLSEMYQALFMGHRINFLEQNKVPHTHGIFDHVRFNCKIPKVKSHWRNLIEHHIKPVPELTGQTPPASKIKSVQTNFEYPASEKLHVSRAPAILTIAMSSSSSNQKLHDTIPPTNSQKNRSLHRVHVPKYISRSDIDMSSPKEFREKDVETLSTCEPLQARQNPDAFYHLIAATCTVRSCQGSMRVVQCFRVAPDRFTRFLGTPADIRQDDTLAQNIWDDAYVMCEDECAVSILRGGTEQDVLRSIQAFGGVPRVLHYARLDVTLRCRACEFIFNCIPPPLHVPRRFPERIQLISTIYCLNVIHESHIQAHVRTAWWGIFSDAIQKLSQRAYDQHTPLRGNAYPNGTFLMSPTDSIESFLSRVRKRFAITTQEDPWFWRIDSPGSGKGVHHFRIQKKALIGSWERFSRIVHIIPPWDDEPCTSSGGRYQIRAMNLLLQVTNVPAPVLYPRPIPSLVKCVSASSCFDEEHFAPGNALESYPDQIFRSRTEDTVPHWRVEFHQPIRVAQIVLLVPAELQPDDTRPTTSLYVRSIDHSVEQIVQEWNQTEKRTVCQQCPGQTPLPFMRVLTFTSCTEKAVQKVEVGTQLIKPGYTHHNGGERYVFVLNQVLVIPSTSTLDRCAFQSDIRSRVQFLVKDADHLAFAGPLSLTRDCLGQSWHKSLCHTSSSQTSFVADTFSSFQLNITKPPLQIPLAFSVLFLKLFHPVTKQMTYAGTIMVDLDSTILWEYIPHFYGLIGMCPSVGARMTLVGTPRLHIYHEIDVSTPRERVVLQDEILNANSIGLAEVPLNVPLSCTSLGIGRGTLQSSPSSASIPRRDSSSWLHTRGWGGCLILCFTPFKDNSTLLTVGITETPLMRKTHMDPMASVHLATETSSRTSATLPLMNPLQYMTHVLSHRVSSGLTLKPGKKQGRENQKSKVASVFRVFLQPSVPNEGPFHDLLFVGDNIHVSEVESSVKLRMNISHYTPVLVYDEYGSIPSGTLEEFSTGIKSGNIEGHSDSALVAPLASAGQKGILALQAYIDGTCHLACEGQNTNRRNCDMLPSMNFLSWTYSLA